MAHLRGVVVLACIWRSIQFENEQVAEVVFDDSFEGVEGDQVPMTLQVANDMRTRVLFAHMVPRRGQCHEHGAEWKNFEKLGHHAVILKCDGQPQ